MTIDIHALNLSPSPVSQTKHITRAFRCPQYLAISRWGLARHRDIRNLLQAQDCQVRHWRFESLVKVASWQLLSKGKAPPAVCSPPVDPRKAGGKPFVGETVKEKFEVVKLERVVVEVPFQPLHLPSVLFPLDPVPRRFHGNSPLKQHRHHQMQLLHQPRRLSLPHPLSHPSHHAPKPSLCRHAASVFPSFPLPPFLRQPPVHFRFNFQPWVVLCWPFSHQRHIALRSSRKPTLRDVMLAVVIAFDLLSKPAGTYLRSIGELY
ncbi:hypothetical protein BKA70DRAFT_271768 [Coprinopsis sp. MPI-PUGE-AT-0042]|nr:hypothetical protein BKA70DRAFT_271768 [Coprinopsis sp. MPI-PUGE-AT-0042]